MTVRENIAFGLKHLAPNEIARSVDHHLKLVGLEDHAEKYPLQLSGGQTQRVALARALAPRPAVVLMDEPFGALDMFTRYRMQEWLSDLTEHEQNTVLFVTHNIEEAVFLSDRVLTVGRGRIVDEVVVPIARPRRGDIKFSPEFVELHRRILDKLEHDFNG